jgi:hypothetical protein
MKAWQTEVVQVVDQGFLTNAEQEFFPYQTCYGTPLDPGCYLLVRRTGVQRQYKKGVAFFGPFASETQAELLVHNSPYLGLLAGADAQRVSA